MARSRGAARRCVGLLTGSTVASRTSACEKSPDDFNPKRNSSSISTVTPAEQEVSPNYLIQPGFADEPNVGYVPTAAAPLPELRHARDVLTPRGVRALGHARREHRDVSGELERHLIEIALHAALP